MYENCDVIFYLNGAEVARGIIETAEEELFDPWREPLKRSLKDKNCYICEHAKLSFNNEQFDFHCDTAVIKEKYEKKWIFEQTSVSVFRYKANCWFNIISF